MPKNKTSFLGPNKADRQKFSLIARSRKDIHQGDATVGQSVLVEQALSKKDEQKKYGVLYDDDYDYLQHMKSVDEFYQESLTEEPEEQKRISNQRTRLPEEVFADEPDFDIDAIGEDMVEEDVDPDVMDALDEVDGELEDDFVLLANEEEHDCNEIVKKKSVLFSRFFDEKYNVDEEDELEEDANVAVESSKSNLTYHQEVAEKQHEKLVREFQSFCDMEGSVGTGTSAVSKSLLYAVSRDQEMFDAMRKVTAKDNEEYTDKEKILASIQESDDDEDKVDPLEAWYNFDRRPKLDCDITSVRSSVRSENIPRVMTVPAPPGHKPQKQKRREEADSTAEEAPVPPQRETVCVSRMKGESADEKRQRKQTVKEAQRNRRQEKKLNRLEFRKAEKLVPATETIILY